MMSMPSWVVVGVRCCFVRLEFGRWAEGRCCLSEVNESFLVADEGVGLNSRVFGYPFHEKAWVEEV